MIYANQVVNFGTAVNSVTVSTNTDFLANTSYVYGNLTINSGVTVTLTRTTDLKVSGTLTNNGIIRASQLTSSDTAGTGAAYTLASPQDILPASANGANYVSSWGTNYGANAIKIMAKKLVNNGQIISSGFDGTGQWIGQNGGTYNNNQGGSGAGYILILAENYSGTNGTLSMAGGTGNTGWPAFSWSYQTNCRSNYVGAYWNCADTTSTCGTQKDWYNQPRTETICDTATGYDGGGAAGSSGSVSTARIYTSSVPPVSGAASSQIVTVTKVAVSIGGAIFWFNEQEQDLEYSYETRI